MSERKLFSVDVSREGTKQVFNYIVEAEDHKMASEQAARLFDDTNHLLVIATHIPFSRVESWNGGRKTEQFTGDGRKEFSLTSDIREIKAYTLAMNGYLTAFVAFTFFMLGVFLSR